jgi:SAM-dependent methyltransferase
MSSIMRRAAMTEDDAGQKLEVRPVTQLPFDTPAAMRFASARAQFLDRFLSSWKGRPFKTVLDAGTGVGYFAGHLVRNYNFQVLGLDARLSNVEEAQKRNPQIEFRLGDVESSEFANHGKFDLVLALGLIYHLENPSRAIRNLADASRDAIVIESLVAPGRKARGWLIDEFPGDDQALANVAWHLTELGIVKLLYRSGIPNVYRPRFKPLHLEFRGNFLKRPTRVFVIGSRLPLESDDYEYIPEPVALLDRAYYFHWPVRDLMKWLLKLKRRFSEK